MLRSPELEVVSERERAAALLQPKRLQLLRALREPDSAAGLARRLGEPRQRLNYHLKALEDAGLVETVEERKKGNCVERVLRATASSYVIGPAAVGDLGGDPSEVQDRFSAAYLIAVAARAIRDLATLGGRARKARKALATLTLETEVAFATPDERNAFTEELAQALARLTARYHRPDAAGARRFRFFIGGHPAITRSEHPQEPRS